jgi:hypothetical protein
MRIGSPVVVESSAQLSDASKAGKFEPSACRTMVPVRESPL